jgi:leukotriene-A4 hydrolase
MRTTFTLRRFAATLALVGMALSAHAQDPLSYARYDQVRTTDLHLDLKADFARKTLSGYAELTLNWLDKSARTLALDTRQLSISRVQVMKDGRWQPASYMLDRFDARKGQALRIAIASQPEKVRIYYRTAPGASALQWMTPAQTLSGKRPFMFSQSQAINARSWAPVQDTPAVRFTYSARVAAPSGMRVVMSAQNDQDGPGKDGWVFNMPQPIPSYLLAIAIGEIGVRNLGPRSAVYAEPQRLEAAAFELADTEKMINAAEALYGPYRWGRYDMIVLPPSFPIGGMENPRLTFLTPTMIAGDRSLNDLIAHELAHSWSGNLVTNASWKHWWLNEGFTTYVTTRILESLYGIEVADMNLQVEQEEALASLKDIPAAKQALVPRAPDVNPDSYTDEGLAYPKGAWFLRTLEQRAGRESFDVFLRAWFDQHAFQSASTEQFVAFLRANLLNKNPDIMPEAELNEWLYGPGIPAKAVRVVSARFGAVDAQRDAWLKGELQTADLSARSWIATEWMHFLNDIDNKAGAAKLKELDDTFSLRSSKNNEIAFRFYLASVHAGYDVRQQLNAFLLSVGRQKFVVPLYTALLKNPKEAAWAKSVYVKARPRYHPETQSSVDKLIKK